MSEQQGEHHEAKVELDPAMPAQYASVPTQEIADGKAMAILSYVVNFVNLPFFLVPLIMRNNEFSLFHAKQSLMIWIAGAVFSAITSILICAGGIGLLLLPFVILFILVVNIFGIINAANGRFKPLPIIGPYAEKWFAGIKKAPGTS